jgi:hypothetical protein
MFVKFVNVILKEKTKCKIKSLFLKVNLKSKS